MITSFFQDVGACCKSIHLPDVHECIMRTDSKFPLACVCICEWCTCMISAVPCFERYKLGCVNISSTYPSMFKEIHKAVMLCCETDHGVTVVQGDCPEHYTLHSALCMASDCVQDGEYSIGEVE